FSYLQWLSNTPGAIRWAAPEQPSGGKLHPTGDIYSFGCIMFKVHNDLPLHDQLAEIKFPHKPLSRPIRTAVKDEHWVLMVRCW
ncbi:hypothetical protein V8E55_004173, partial [Tylopilus felleus]